MFAAILCLHISCICRPPRITLVVILDQLSDEIFQQQTPYYQGMLKTLWEKGVSYKRCYHPHAKPKTATGHATFATGGRACEHGIVDNSWLRSDGERAMCDAGDPQQSAVINPYAEAPYPQAKSPRELWLDTVFDQCALYTRHITSMVIAGKSRAAIMFAGNHGQTFWFDDASGGITSSRAYMQQLPQWLTQFNHDYRLSADATYTWHPIYAPESGAYSGNISSYPGTNKQPRFNAPFTLSRDSDTPFHAYLAMPQGQKRLIDAAQAGLSYELYQHPDNNILLCLSLSSLDYTGHYHGPQSAEYRDLLYHADRDLQELYTWITQQIPEDELLMIFTSDHGSMPMPEQMYENGMSFAQRIDNATFVNDLNTAISERFGISDYVIAHSQPWIHINQKRHRELSFDQQKHITAYIIDYLRDKPYIIDAFTQDMLQQLATPHPYAPHQLLQNHVTPGRTGQIMYLIRPYCNITTYATGTTHATPYAYDTHVPFIIYQPGVYEQAHREQAISAQQLAPTLARILDIPQPSGSYMPPLEIPTATKKHIPDATATQNTPARTEQHG